MSVFRWRKRNEEFEWREYVRTTILFRRNERRKRVEEAKAAAAFGVKQAGHRGAHAVAEHSKTAGRYLAVATAWLFRAMMRFGRWSAAAIARAAAQSAQAASSVLSRVGPNASRAAGVAGPVLSQAGARLIAALMPAWEFLRSPQITLPLVLIALVSALSSGHRFWIHGLDSQAMTSGLVALTALIAIIGSRLATGGGPHPLRAFSLMMNRVGERLVLLPGLDRLTPRAAGVASLVLLVALTAGSAWFFASRTSFGLSLASIIHSSPLQLEGRATAIAGDTLRLSGSTVVLDGIEAPERDQSCGRPGEQWSCARAAKEALSDILQGKRIVCEITGTNETGEMTARCGTNGEDVAAKLVEGGHVFAKPGIFARYGSIESTAKSEKAGFWMGAAQRPAEYRAKLWEEAKRAAPEGCPIKGRVASGGRVYLLPWSPSYNNIRIMSSRGERWFCTEAEAQAAGWKPVAPS
jgi:endonuclease YncB( thermonuclease family)